MVAQYSRSDPLAGAGHEYEWAPSGLPDPIRWLVQGVSASGAPSGLPDPIRWRWCGVSASERHMHLQLY